MDGRQGRTEEGIFSDRGDAGRQLDFRQLLACRESRFAEGRQGLVPCQVCPRQVLAIVNWNLLQ